MEYGNAYEIRTLLHDALKSTVDEEKCAQIFTEVFRRICARRQKSDVRQYDRSGPPIYGALDPGMERYFHYRSIDVSTIKELCRRWAPEKVWVGTCVNKHQALADIAESIHDFPGIGGKYFVSN